MNLLFDFTVLGERMAVVAFFFSPIVLGYLVVFFYRQLKQAQFIKKLDWVLLEIKLPRELRKSPQAMEIVLAAMHQPLEGTWFTRLTEGVVRHWFSLEMVSFGGSVHFYIRTNKGAKNLIESQIYAQYPGVEVLEVDDYTANVPYGLPAADWDLAGFEFQLTKEDPYPIRTYIDYGLDKNPKEEEKVDPMGSLVELLGSIKSGEQMWFQFLIMASKDRFMEKGAWFKKISWTKKAQEIIKERMSKYKESGDKISLTSLPPGEEDIIKAIQRSIGKFGFDTGIRAIYLGKKDIFNKANFGAMAGVMKQFSTENLNGFRPAHSTSIKYPWQDIFGWKIIRYKWRMFDEYRRRAYFYNSLFRQKKIFVLNTEELATLYHLPGQVVETPTFERIESRRAEPPPNLPIDETES
ncbi:MAG: hypothetical protein WDZ85_02690 [Candidatus Paceibacterota bacterium]